jgi:anti-sigma regulatory factor (Ser/Thr protein kinase)
MAPHRILFQGTDTTVADILREELPDGEYRIDVALGGMEEILADHPDVLVAELGEPQDGLYLLPRLRERIPGTKILLLTSNSSPDELIAALRMGAFAVFHKPFSRIAFCDMVREAVSCETCADDIALLSAVPHWVAVQMACRIAAVDRVVQFYREFDMDLPDEDREQIATALHELLMNAVEHGGRSDARKKVNVTRLRTSAFLGFYIRDPGEGFSFDKLEHAAVSNPPDSVAGHLEKRIELGMRPGGFGISMARDLLDGLYYNEKGNEVILIKNLPR